MHIVYLLTNESKKEGRRFYIGSKIDCDIIEIDGYPTIIDPKKNKPYYGSSQSEEMRGDLLKGDRFSAKILEKLKSKLRKNVFEAERKWMVELGAVESPEFYNLALPFNLDRKHPDYENAVCNKYGEMLREYAKNQSSCSKRDNRAMELGFSNFGEMAFHFQDCIDSGENGVVVGERLGLHRHFLWVCLRGFNMEKAKQEKTRTDLIPAIRDCIMNGASLYKTAEILGIEQPAARYLLGDFNSAQTRSFYAAKKLGKTKNELEIAVTKMVLDGIEFGKIAKMTGLTLASVRRYFLRCVRSRLKSSDFN